MRLTITQDKLDLYTVEVDDKYADRLNADEALGVVISVLHGDGNHRFLKSTAFEVVQGLRDEISQLKARNPDRHEDGKPGDVQGDF